jgi:hypothetical protein
VRKNAIRTLQASANVIRDRIQESQVMQLEEAVSYLRCQLALVADYFDSLAAAVPEFVREMESRK